MASISSVGTSTATTTTSKSALTGSQTMGKDEFLKLLVTQMRNQDPMNPLQGSDFAAQLAQFSSVEQLINIGKSLESSGQTQGVLAQSINSGVAAGLIGKQVEVDRGMIQWKGTGQQPLAFSLEDKAAAVRVTIRNADGKTVRTIDLKDLAKGDQTDVMWDGRTDSNTVAPAGTYTVEVQAADANGNTVVSHSSMGGRVDRVSFGSDGIQLWIGNVAVPMSSVRSVQQ